MKVKHIIGIISGSTSFLSRIPVLFKMLKASLSGKYRPGIKNLFIFSLLVMYLLFPIDLIPDFLVGIGILDDLTIAFFALTRLFKEVDNYAEWKEQRNKVAIIE
jgi:uncharacterized membrane protein YkvA (DUF1232 family)